MQLELDVVACADVPTKLYTQAVPPDKHLDNSVAQVHGSRLSCFQALVNAVPQTITCSSSLILMCTPTALNPNADPELDMEGGRLIGRHSKY